MIRSFGSNDTTRIWDEQYVKRIHRTVQRAVLRKLAFVHAAMDLDDLRIHRATVWGSISAAVAGSTAPGEPSGEETALWGEGVLV